MIISDQLLDGLTEFKNIRSICPLVDTFEDSGVTDCTGTWFDLSNMRSMYAIIGQEADTQILKSDSYSTYYGNQDGYSFCLGTYTVYY